MKIAMFADSFHPTVDGSVVALETTCDGLEKRGHEVVILAPRVQPTPATKRKVHYLPSAEFRQYPGYRVVFSPSDMLEFLREEKVDFIHSHGLAAMGILSLTAARALKIPSLLTFHTMANEAMKHYSPIGLRDEMSSALVWIYLRNLLKRPEVVIAPSAPVKQELEANGVRMKECAVVPTGVDCARFTPEKYDKHYMAKYGFEGKEVLLHVGRLSVEKRLDIILKAIAGLARRQPNLRLLVGGTGPAEQEYKAMAVKLGIADRVVFAGFMPAEELPVAYASSDALIIASAFETQGLVVLEALASGTPVIGARYRAIPEFVREGWNGCLFNHEDCEGAIQRCLDRRDSMMLDAVSSARLYSVDACTGRLEEAYALAGKVAERIGIVRR